MPQTPLTPDEIHALFAPREQKPRVLTAADIAERARNIVPKLPPPEYYEYHRASPEYPISPRGTWLRKQHALCPRCVYCKNSTGLGPDHGLLQATVDHRQPLARGGPDHESNWVLACMLCNVAKADGDYTPRKRRDMLTRINMRALAGKNSGPLYSA